MSSLCEKCVTDKSICDRCRDNPKYKDYPSLSLFQKYLPTCPQGYSDCVHDPSYIKFHYPEWYKELYGDLSPGEASAQDCDRNCSNCYDDEDK